MMGKPVEAGAAKLAGLQMDLLSKYRNGQLSLEELGCFLNMAPHLREERFATVPVKIVPPTGGRVCVLDDLMGTTPIILLNFGSGSPIIGSLALSWGKHSGLNTTTAEEVEFMVRTNQNLHRKLGCLEAVGIVHTTPNDVGIVDLWSIRDDERRKGQSALSSGYFTEHFWFMFKY